MKVAKLRKVNQNTAWGFQRMDTEKAKEETYMHLIRIPGEEQIKENNVQKW